MRYVVTVLMSAALAALAASPATAQTPVVYGGAAPVVYSSAPLPYATMPTVTGSYPSFRPPEYITGRRLSSAYRGYVIDVAEGPGPGYGYGSGYGSYQGGYYGSVILPTHRYVQPVYVSPAFVAPMAPTPVPLALPATPFVR